MRSAVQTESSREGLRLPPRPKVDVVTELKTRLGTTDAACVMVEPYPGPHERYKSLLHFANPQLASPSVTTLPSVNTEAQARAILAQIIPVEEAFKILVALAQARAIRAPLVIEGGTSLGKTYLVERFTELMLGVGVKPIDLYCNKQTDASELMGKWVPRVHSENDRQVWDRFLESSIGVERIESVQVEIAALAQRGAGREQLEGTLRERFRILAAELGLGSSGGDFEFQLGAAPKAFMEQRLADGRRVYHPGGTGNLLHIEEVGLAQPGVVNALLQLRGSHGRLAASFQLFQDGGREIPAGVDTQLVLSTNPPEGAGYKSRNEVDAALAAGSLWLSVEELSLKSLTIAAQYFFTFRIGASEGHVPPSFYDVRSNHELGVQIASLMALFHQHYQEKTTGAAGGRLQQIPRTVRSFGQVAALLEHAQVGDHANQQFDIVSTLRNAVEFVYLAPLSSNAELLKDLRLRWEMLLSDQTIGQVDYRGQLVSRKTLFEKLTLEQPRAATTPRVSKASTKTDPRVAEVLKGL